MKLACSTWNFTEELESGVYPDLAALITDLAGIGFDGVEIMGYHLECIDRDYLTGLRQHATALGMCVSAVDARNLALGRPWPEYRTDITLIKTWIEAAAVLGCPSVVVFLGGFDSEEGHVAQLDRDAAAFAECARFAAPRQVRLGIENHRVYLTPREVDPPGREIEDILRLMGRLAEASVDVGTTPDNDNVFRKQYHSLSAEERNRAMDAFRSLLPRAVHVHAKVRNDPDAEEPQQFPAETVVAALRQSGYNGHLGIEFMKPVVGDKLDLLARTVSDYRRALCELQG